MTKREIMNLANRIDDARKEWAKGNSEYANMELQTIVIKLKDGATKH